MRPRAWFWLGLAECAEKAGDVDAALAAYETAAAAQVCILSMGALHCLLLMLCGASAIHPPVSVDLVVCCWHLRGSLRCCLESQIAVLGSW